MKTDRRTSIALLGMGALAGCSGPVGRAGGGTAKAQSAGGIARSWATGGTASMSGMASYPDPFASGIREACSLTCEQILGPCYAPQAPLRQDISEGEPGIPLRMAFQLVNQADCAPMAGCEVEIWHTNHSGHYSAEDVQGGDFCTSDDAHAEASYFHRGRAISDEEGKVIFDSCFPGWYSSRAVHVHVIVRLPAHAGERDPANMQTVTQLYFPEDMTTQIHQDVAGYADRGQPQTSLSRDMVTRSVGGAEAFTFEVMQMEDGAMLASKTISLAEDESCGARGFGGGFGGGFRGGFGRRPRGS